ncbi:MAG: hypothetical protein WDN10_01620 [bacterium]
MKKYLAPFAAIALLTPLLAGAATISSVSDVGTTVINIINNVLVPVLFAVAFIVFIWGAFQVFIIGANDEDAKEKGKKLMLYGLIGFFVMVSIWGLVNILVGTFSTNNATPPLPQADF